MNNAEDTLMNIDICDRLGCTVDHRNNLDECYNLIIRSLSVASEEFVFVRSDEFTPVTGWNTHCKEKYTAARDAMIQQRDNGKIRYGDIFENMKITRKNFVNALNYCKKYKK